MATTTGAAYPSAYAATDAGFKRYYDAVQQNFADKGMYDSTTKRQPLLDVADAYASKLATEQRTDTQNAFTNAMNLWELITSGQLSKASLTGSRTVNLPSQPGVFADIFNYKIPQYSSTGPTGDADTANTTPYIHKQYGDVIPSYDEQITTLDYKNAQTDAANAAKSLALQQAYLKLAQSQDARAATAAAAGADTTTEATTDWNTIATNILSAVQGGGDAGSLLKEAYALYGVDILSEAKAGNPRAQAILDAIGYKELDRTQGVGKFLDEKWSGILNNPRYSGEGWGGTLNGRHVGRADGSSSSGSGAGNQDWSFWHPAGTYANR